MHTVITLYAYCNSPVYIGLLQYVYRVITVCIQDYYSMNTGLLQYVYRVITVCIQGYYSMYTGLLQYVTYCNNPVYIL
jgi:hypothetical protein